MPKKPFLNRVDRWVPGCWCVAVIKLCDNHKVTDGVDETFYPEEWAYFLWEPRDNALPFALPDGFAVESLSPLDEIFADIGQDRIYFLAEDEADWPMLLEILLACDNHPPWLGKIIRELQETKRNEQRQALINHYGASASQDFITDMRRLMENGS